MRMAIIGLPASGKTTLFDAITGRRDEPGSYAAPGSTQLGVVHLLDPRVDAVAEIVQPKRITYVLVEFIDLAGLFATPQVDPDSATALRDADGLVKVVRAFENPAVPGSIDPRRDLDEINADLFVVDLDILERRIERLEQSVKKPTPRQDAEKAELALLERCRKELDAVGAIARLHLTEDEWKTLRGFRFLTEKPGVIVANIGESQVGDESVAASLGERHEPILAVCGDVEKELLGLDPEERGPFLADLGLAELSAQKLVRASLGALDLISFFTAGDKELRAWLIPRGTTAVEAAGKVHTDFARGFVRAEVIASEDFAALGGWKECKAKGKEHLEGKDYVVQDGDILHVRFSV
jgi:GTP-binding protein YchF